jgi:hypothetical protein
VPPDPPGRPTAGLTHLALASVRCGPWEVFTLGVIWHGRVLPVGWAVVAYPWPMGQCTPTVLGLVRQVAAARPEQRPVHLVADRAFPSRALFGLLHRLHWRWTVRLQATSWVRLDGRDPRSVRTVLDHSQYLGWTTYAAAQYASGR